MKRRVVVTVAAVALLIFVAANKYNDVVNKRKEELTKGLVFSALRVAHYDKKEIDDEFSREVFDLYLERLDYSKKFLLQEDVERLRKYRDKIDDELELQEDEFFELSVQLITKRVKEAEQYYEEILSHPFDYRKYELIEVDDKKNPWAANKAVLKESWRKALKYQTELEISTHMKIQDAAKAKGDTSVKIKTFEVLEKEAREKVRKRNKDWFHRLNQIEHFDRLSTFLNAIAGVYDPHTNYFPPKDKEDFDISMSGQLEGIGATLQEKDGYIKVVRIVPGSPSWKQGELKANDLILKVAQGDEEPVDIVGMRLDKAVRLIRGKKGTLVKLTVKKVDGSIKVIPIVRDVVVIEATYAKSVIVSTEKGKRVGYIYLPQFYVNFNKRDGGRRCSEDVLKEIKKLNAEHIDGLIIDLRNNGGGSLPDVVKMAGYFIPRGPIVQVKQAGMPAQTLDDTDPAVYYDGPMAVMVNGNSASASEIFAAAMQDYRRAVIIGSSMTFGKGTVQRFIDLDKVVNSAQAAYKPFGAVKLTFQKFYRINGGSTQLKGVSSDIVLPDNMMYIKYGERELEYHLDWDKIAPADYLTYNKVKGLERIEYQEQKAVENDEEFKKIKERAAKIKEVRENTEMSLHWNDFYQYQKDLEAANKTYEKLMTDTTAVKIIPLQVDMLAAKEDTVKREVARKWHKNLSKDIYLREAANVVNMMVENE